MDPEIAQQIDNIQINFAAENIGLLNAALSIIMFGVALGIQVSDFKGLIRHPKPTIIGLISQFLIVPAITLVIIYAFRPSPSVALGLVLVASCPSGTVSNFATLIAKGNVALSIMLTSVSTIAALVWTPANFWLWTRWIPHTEGMIESFQLNIGDISQQILKLILLPLIAGMLIRHFYPKIADRLTKPIKLISFLIFAVIIVLALIVNYENIKNYVGYVFLLVLAHNALAMASGFGFATLNKLAFPDVKAVTIETGVHNTALGLVLIFTFFDGLGGMALVAAWWGIWDLIAPLALAYYWGRKASN